MTRSLIPGIILLLAGLVLAVLPFYLLPVCSDTVTTIFGDQMPMKCHWTARAVLGVGILIAAGGLSFCLSGHARTRAGIAWMTALSGLLAVAIPVRLIGVCPSEAMPCRMGTYPGVIVAGALVFAVGLFAAWRESMKAKGKKD